MDFEEVQDYLKITMPQNTLHKRFVSIGCALMYQSNCAWKKTSEPEDGGGNQS
jgi:hypothetical protein